MLLALNRPANTRLTCKTPSAGTIGVWSLVLGFSVMLLRSANSTTERSSFFMRVTCQDERDLSPTPCGRLAIGFPTLSLESANGSVWTTRAVSMFWQSGGDATARGWTPARWRQELRPHWNLRIRSRGLPVWGLCPSRRAAHRSRHSHNRARHPRLLAALESSQCDLKGTLKGEGNDHCKDEEDDEPVRLPTEQAHVAFRIAHRDRLDRRIGGQGRLDGVE